VVVAAVVTPQLCTICPARPARPVLTDSLACEPCVKGLEQLLKTLDEQLPRLRAFVQLGATAPDDGVRSGRRADSPAPLRIDVLSLLDPRNERSPGKILAKWAAVFGTPATPVGLRQAMNRIIEHDQLRAFARDLRALAVEVSQACGEQGPAVRRVAACRRDLPARDGDGTRECGGPIMAAPDGDVAVCGSCGDRWPRDRWQLLGRLQAT
jgi:hypothetical protein